MGVMTESPQMTQAEALTHWDDAPVDYIGTAFANMEPSVGYAQRKRRCYELSTYAVVFGDAPEGSVLVHGTWQGPGAPFPIGHGWVILPDGHVWEPISGKIITAQVWQALADPVNEVTYTPREARVMVAASGHYGAWHETAGA